MKAFNIEAEKATHIIDAVNEVSNNYAVSSADLANNLGIVSATMAAGDTTLEETLGLMASITEITRDASRAANALKTIGQRLRAVGEDGGEYIGDLQKAFDEYGISIEIVNAKTGEMSSTYDILKAIADRWNDLNDAQRQTIGELAAGKQRITDFNNIESVPRNWFVK